jgi:transketolase C-terminal domain/subunit
MMRVGTAAVYSESAPNDDLLRKYGLTASHIAQAARSLCERRAAHAQR